MLNKTFILLSDDGWGCIPALLVVWPEQPSTGAYRLFGGADGLQEGSCQRILPRTAAASVFVPTELPPTFAGGPPVLAGRSGPVFYSVTAFIPWVLVCTRLCVCPPGMEFLFPSVLCKPCSQIPLAFKGRFSGDSFSHCWTPRLEA